MKMRKLALGAVMLAGLGACSPAIEGKWCAVGESGSIELKGGKVTSNSGETGSYKVNGKEVVLTEDRQGGDSMTFTLTGKDTMDGPQFDLEKCK